MNNSPSAQKQRPFALFAAKGLDPKVLIFACAPDHLA
jgi:hypothetical protein